jgi:hypothetical protein
LRNKAGFENGKAGIRNIATHPINRYTLNEQKIGKLFLDIAPTMRSNLLEYCEKHSDFVEFINQKTGQIEKKQLVNDQIDMKAMVLGLSLVFRHIQKYASILHEIERNTPVWTVLGQNHKNVIIIFFRKHIRIEAISNEQLKFILISMSVECRGIPLMLSNLGRMRIGPAPTGSPIGRCSVRNFTRKIWNKFRAKIRQIVVHWESGSVGSAKWEGGKRGQ